jgi:hypothetical protein
MEAAPYSVLSSSANFTSLHSQLGGDVCSNIISSWHHEKRLLMTAWDGIANHFMMPIDTLVALSLQHLATFKSMVGTDGSCASVVHRNAASLSFSFRHQRAIAAGFLNP